MHRILYQSMMDVIAKTRSQIDPNRGKVIWRSLQIYLENLTNLRNIMDEVMKHPRVRAEIDAAIEQNATRSHRKQATCLFALK